MRAMSSPITLEAQDRSIETTDLVLTETIRQPGLVLPRHCHKYTNIALVIQGSFIETVAQDPYEVSPASLILRPAGEMHTNRYGRAEARCLVIEVKPPRLEMIRQVSPVLDCAAHIRGGWVTVLAQRLAQEFQMKDSASPLAIEALTLDLLAQASRRSPENASSSKPRWLRRARELIREQFAQPLSLSYVAESVGVHPSHLARMFRRHYQCTVGDYMRRLRLETAVEELIHSDKSLAEIALSAGFYDQSHFTHAFRLRFGLTPSDFRAAGKAHTKRSRSYKTS
jgi:AraC family transcriptional regulator